MMRRKATLDGIMLSCPFYGIATEVRDDCVIVGFVLPKTLSEGSLYEDYFSYLDTKKFDKFINALQTVYGLGSPTKIQLSKNVKLFNDINASGVWDCVELAGTITDLNQFANICAKYNIIYPA